MTTRDRVGRSGSLLRPATNVLSALLLALMTHAVGAHHSFAMFDRQRTLTMSGTVRELQWTNPHVWIQVIVRDADDREQEWSIEGGARNMMARQGWTGRTLLPGDEIGLVIRPALDGSLAGSLVSVTLADGTVLGPGGAPPPSNGNAPPPSGVDFTGIWLGVRDIESPYTITPYPSPPPFTEEGRRLSQYWDDPSTNLGARCIPGGGPAGMMNGSSFFPIEIIQRPEQVTLLFELMHQVRRIFMDGRGHPPADEIDNTWMGHSIGRWDGATLVIDTVGVNAGVLNGSGAAVVLQDTDRDPRMPYTETMHLTERWRLIDDGEYLETALTITDPTVYTEPLRLTRYWKRSPETPMLEYICTENPRPEDEGFGELLD